MVQKRQLCEDEYDVSPKHLKLEHNSDLVPSLQFSKENVPLHSDKDGYCLFKPNIEVEKGIVSGAKEVDCTLSGRLSTSSWASSSVSDEDAMSEAILPRFSDTYSYLLECSPLKQVSIGPEYQADIPEWGECNEDEVKFMGYTVVPMPEHHQMIHANETVARGKTGCHCQNPGSVECVRQHVKEAREILKARIGLQTFVDLGFGDMGEVVAEKWTDDDEQLFHEVVYSNPVSSGRNFWNHLAAEFPSRSSQEIVSYYFNVFMLRRRAEQNRVDPMNVDSDDDESQEYDSSEYGNGLENCSSDSQPKRLHNSCSFDSISEKTIVNDSADGGHDFLYDSCTSSDTAGAPCTSKVNNSWANHEFTFEPLDPRVWDVGYFSRAGTKTDFLPTGSMIEEVFGVESWNFETTDVDNKSSN
ncbi:hypothetical protein QVD17_10607 [Tagetes erecta]|uniref:Myb-like domain-containing protein n=1 Tax=Tagetes erecta TaxID=13708 RepID=A0AAD8L896_TARER|nr:hypothetical protein QVD17_10607 [Tagetes erecta]